MYVCMYVCMYVEFSIIKKCKKMYRNGNAFIN